MRYGLVVKADGLIPLADDVSDEHRDAIVGHLVMLGVPVQRTVDGHLFVPDWDQHRDKVAQSG